MNMLMLIHIKNWLDLPKKPSILTYMTYIDILYVAKIFPS